MPLSLLRVNASGVTARTATLAVAIAVFPRCMQLQVLLYISPRHQSLSMFTALSTGCCFPGTAVRHGS